MVGHTDSHVSSGVRVVSLLCVLALTFIFARPTTAAAWSQEQPAGESGARVFRLEEVSISDCPEPVRSRLLLGQYAPECGDVPLPGVTYPEFKSDRPIYGAITFDMSIFDPQAGIRYCFAVDESGGTGTGYDKLYFDLNRDSDLTNDAPVTRVQDTPAGMPGGRDTISFETIRVGLDYGPDGIWTQAVTPRLMSMSNVPPRMFFAAPTARKGKIVLGSDEVELVLAQYQSIAGRYDRPMTGVFLTGKTELLPFLACWPHVDGTFYRLSPTPAGDKISVEPYSGPFGTLEIGTGGRDIAQPGVDIGFLQSNEAFIDLTACTRTDGKWNVPVGDYRPLRMGIRYGERRIGLSADLSQAGQMTVRPAVFPFSIRHNAPFVLDFPGKPEVIFVSPGDKPVRAGETLRVGAILRIPGMDMMIAALEDTTRKTGSMKMPDGRDFDRFESLDPAIRIVNTAGQTMAEGKMPFG
jgi:hypothetical protein